MLQPKPTPVSTTPRAATALARAYSRSTLAAPPFTIPPNSSSGQAATRARASRKSSGKAASTLAGAKGTGSRRASSASGTTRSRHHARASARSASMRSRWRARVRARLPGRKWRPVA